MKKVFKRIGKAIFVALVVSKVIDGFAYSGIAYHEAQELKETYGYGNWYFEGAERANMKAFEGWSNELKKWFKR